MNQHTAASIKGILNKSIAFRGMLKQVLIFNIIHLNSLVCEAVEKTLLNR